MMKNAALLPPTIEFKSFHFELKSVDEEQGIITGYLSAFNNIDDGDDRVRPGAFKKTIGDALERKSSKGKKFLWPHLWMHEPNQPVGGFTEATEDANGLLTVTQLDISTNDHGIPNNPQAVMVFSGYKSGYISEMSIGYKAIRWDYKQEQVNGKTVNVRDLLEIQLWEGSSCTLGFAMNPEATVTGVKSMDIHQIDSKTICGNTSGAIGPRDEAWDGSEAEKQIWVAAEKEDGTISASTAKKYFMVCENDGSKKGDFSYPFWYVGDSPHICVGAVIAVAGAIGGARAAEAPDGLKGKVETLYAKINRKYPDATPLVPKWKDDGKARNRSMDKKDFTTLFQTAQAADALEDWGDLINTLTQTMMQAFCMGDEPQSDMKDALDQFGTAVMSWCEDAVSCGMDDYLSDQGYGGNNSPYVPYSLRVGGNSYGYMSRDTHDIDTKKGAAFSQASKDALSEQVKALQDMASEHQNMSDTLAKQYKSMKAFHAGMQEKAKGIASGLEDLYTSEGQNPPYVGNDNPDTSKSRTPRTPPHLAPARPVKMTIPPPALGTDTSLDELDRLLAV